MKSIMKYQTLVGNLLSLLLVAANVLAISFIIMLAANNGLAI